MANAIIIVEFNGRRAPPRSMNEENLKRHSGTLQKLLDAMPTNKDRSPKEVTIQASHGPMSKVLDEIAKQRNRPFYQFKIALQGLAIDQIAMLWQVAEMLDLKPRQNKIKGHIRGHISHDKLKTAEFVTLHKVFYETRNVVDRGERTSVWDLLIHHTAWNADQSVYTEAECNALEAAAAAESPDLVNAVRNKMLGFQKRQQIAERRKEQDDKKKLRKQSKEIGRRVAAYKDEERERQQEALRGERELTEATARGIMTRAPETWVATVTEGKHGQRNPAGQGKRTRRGGQGGTEARRGWAERSRGDALTAMSLQGVSHSSLKIQRG